MKMKNIYFMQKMMFFVFLMLSIIISVSSNSFLSIWMALEINLISAIPIFSISNSSKNEKAIMIYFLIQSISSILLLMSILSNNIYEFKKSIFMFLIYFSLFMKMGLWPFHFWVLPVMEGLTWMGCFVLSTIQKIIPLMMLFYLLSKNFILSLCVLNSLFASLMGISQFSIRKIMGFSSINHLSIMILSILISKSLFKTYFLFYFVLSFSVFLNLDKMNLNYLFQSFSIWKISMLSHLNIIFMMFTLSGTPPFLGFFPKMMVILKLMEMNFFIVSFFILSLNVLATFFYFKITMSSLILNLTTFKLKKKNTNKSILFTWVTLLGPVLLFFWGLSLN